MPNPISTILSLDVCAKIDAWLERYPPEQRASGVMQALFYAQEANGGYLSTELLQAVADYLGMEHSKVYEVATFYTMYNLNPVGKHVVSVCTSLSCVLNKSKDLLAHIRQRLALDASNTSADGKFTVREVECLGACINAPAIQIDKDYYESVSIAAIDEILDKI